MLSFQYRYSQLGDKITFGLSYLHNGISILVSYHRVVLTSSHVIFIQHSYYQLSQIVSLYFCLVITHWGRVTHICISKLTIIGSDNGLAPIIIKWTLRNKLQWNLNRNIFIQENPFESVVCETVAILSLPQCVNYCDSWWMVSVAQSSIMRLGYRSTHTYYSWVSGLLIPQAIMVQYCTHLVIAKW